MEQEQQRDVDTMCFLPSALNFKVEKINQARVDGGSCNSLEGTIT